MTDKNGVTEREHLEQIEKATGRRPDFLDGPEIPTLAEPVWDYFRQMHGRRTYGMEGPHPLTYESILAWCNLYAIRLSWWEMEAVESLDTTWLNVMRERKDGG